jgi:hypothetical protein
MLTATPLVSLPPGPKTLPAQQARQWIERPLDLLDACAREFGDVFTLQLGALGATVMFGHPESVKTIFRAASHSFECQHFNESYRFVHWRRGVADDGANAVGVANRPGRLHD